MPLNLGPNPSMMNRILGATNAAGQGMGGPWGETSRLSAGLNQGRLNKKPMPARQTMPNTGMMPPGGAPMGMPDKGAPMGASPNMPIVQGPSNPAMMVNGNPGANPGMPPSPMGGFPRPQIETGNMINNSPMGNGLWEKYQSMMGRQPMQPMFR